MYERISNFLAWHKRVYNDFYKEYNFLDLKSTRELRQLQRLDWKTRETLYMQWTERKREKPDLSKKCFESQLHLVRNGLKRRNRVSQYRSLTGTAPESRDMFGGGEVVIFRKHSIL